MKDNNDYHTLSLYYWPRVVPDALHVLSLILRAIHSDMNCIQKKELGLRELKTCQRVYSLETAGLGFKSRPILISKLIYFHYLLSAHI